MKKISLVLSCLLFSILIYAQELSIEGMWYTSEKDAVVEIFKDGNKFSGKTVWMKEPFDKNGNPKLDKKNPDNNLTKRKRMGLKIMKGFVYKGNNIWDEGTIYKPANGKTYGGKATLVNKNTLRLKGYILGMPLLGKTTEWTRKID